MLPDPTVSSPRRYGILAVEPGLMRSSDSHRRRRRMAGSSRSVEARRTLGAPAEGAGMNCVLAAQHARCQTRPCHHPDDGILAWSPV
jgi:hypothetical protein